MFNRTACDDVVVDEVSLARLTCVAPMGAGRTPLIVQVGSQSGTFAFVYDRPRVTRVTPSPLDAEAPGVVQVMVLFRNAVAAGCRRHALLSR